MPKYRVIVEYGVAYEVEADNEAEAKQIVQEDTEGMTKTYIHEEYVAVERIPAPKMRAEGFFIEEEDDADIQS